MVSAVKIEFEESELRPLVERVVEQTVTRLMAEHAQANGRIAFTEAEAATLVGVPRHSLRDARLRGEINASRIGRRIIYSREELLAYVGRNRVR